MKSLMYRGLVIIGVCSFLYGCGGSSSDSVTSTNTPSSSVSLTGVVVSAVDSSNKPLKNVNVTIKSKTTGVAVGGIATGAIAPLTTNASGDVSFPNLVPDEYELEFDDGQGGPKIKTTFKVDAGNKDSANEKASVIIPASQDSYGNLKKVDALVASLSGNVFDLSSVAPIAGVTVSLSSSKIGIISSSTTDLNGAYTLIVNVSKKNTGALNDLALTFSAAPYSQHKVTGLQVFANTNLSGFDVSLSPLTAQQNADKQALVASSYDFSNLTGWTMTGLWHQHSSGLNIKNAAVTNGLVELAPGDVSLGLVSDAVSGNAAMWFGAAQSGVANETGNFIGSSDSYANVNGSKNGGQSTVPVSGLLTSPAIDLTALPIDSYVSLTFDTWWEIESVNPNANGFDLMTIRYSIDGGLSWVDLARLNPLVDPQTDTLLVRDSIPYSNNGFNAAPSWIKQERIPLVDPTTGASLAGKSVQVQFSFDTVDTLFNGFRGWIIDNVEVSKVAGSFPVMDPYSAFVNPNVSQAWDWIGLAWNTATNDVNITPSVASALPSGTTTTISGTFEYESSSAVSAQLAFSIDGGVLVAVTSSAVTLVPSSGVVSTASLSAGVTPVLGNVFVDVWVQMLDAAGAVVLEVPVAFYTVQ